MRRDAKGAWKEVPYLALHDLPSLLKHILGGGGGGGLWNVSCQCLMTPQASGII